MAQTPSDAGPSSSTLARGKACLRCRKRKMRCDGAKPACAQCVRAHKSDACQYDDGKGKTRTQALREKIARLEEEIAQLRDPLNPSAPAIVLHDPHAPTSSPSSGSSDAAILSRRFGAGQVSSGASTPSSSPVGSPSSSSVGLSTTASPYSNFESFGSPPTAFPPTRTVSPAMLHSSEEVPPEILRGLLEIVIIHRSQCGLALHVERLRSSLSMASMALGHAVNFQFSGQLTQQPRHPVLANAIYLWASFLSRPGPLSLNEQHFLSRTQIALVDALNFSQHHHQAPASPRLLHQHISGSSSTLSPPLIGQSPSPKPSTSAPVVIDTIQAAVLLARYFFAIGRLHEASYYSNAAASLAVQSGLHQINSSLAIVLAQQQQVPAFAGLNAVYSSSLRLSPPRDGIELGERINLFWQVFVLDRLLSVALRRPPCIVDDDSIESRIDTPWPEEVEEYEHMPLDSVQGDRTLQTFYLQQGQPTAVPGGFSSLSLLSKAAALYCSATHASTNWGMRRSETHQGSSSSSSSSSHANPAQDLHGLEVTISRFLATLLPVNQLSAGLPDGDRRGHIAIHMLAHAAFVQLHLRFAREGNMQSMEKCLRSARNAAQLVRHLVDNDYDYIDPAFGACWATIANAFSLEWQTATQNRPQQREFDVIVFAMTRLSAKFPIMELLISKVYEGSASP